MQAATNNTNVFYCTANILFIKPYQKARKNFHLSFPYQDQQSIIREPLSVRKKISYLVKGLMYCLPVINTIVYLAQKYLFSDKKILDLPDQMIKEIFIKLPPDKYPKDVSGSFKKWKKHFENDPFNKLAEENLVRLERVLSNAINDIDYTCGHDNLKTKTSTVAELHFKPTGELENILYGYEKYRGSCEDFPLEKRNFICIPLQIRLTSYVDDNHQPFSINQKDRFENEDLHPLEVRKVMQLMLDKLNYRDSELAVIDFKAIRGPLLK